MEHANKNSLGNEKLFNNFHDGNSAVKNCQGYGLDSI
jgi:hypothetical protein